jgi:hypothetical protein
MMQIYKILKNIYNYLKLSSKNLKQIYNKKWVIVAKETNLNQPSLCLQSRMRSTKASTLIK